MKLIKRNFCNLICLLLFFQFNHVQSLENSIIVRVGNQIITSFELENKIKSVLFLNNDELSQENINKVKKISLKTLIDLKLKKEKFIKYKFKLDDIVINSHLEKLSYSLQIEKKNLKNLFLSNGIDYDQYLEDIRIELSWQRLIYALYNKEIKLEENQILDDLNKIISEKESLEEYNLSEIEVNFINNKNKEELIKEIRNNIDSEGFGATAKKYSISTTSIDSGKLGWINSAGLSEKLLNILSKMRPGDISKPIISVDKILLLKVNDVRKISNKDNIDINKLKESIINKKQNEMLNLYASSHLSKKRNGTNIKFLNE